MYRRSPSVRARVARGGELAIPKWLRSRNSDAATSHTIVQVQGVGRRVSERRGLHTIRVSGPLGVKTYSKQRSGGKPLSLFTMWHPLFLATDSTLGSPPWNLSAFSGISLRGGF